jgi:RsiW-degrading membrane proteinase PrsW (M82 family)
MVKTQQLSLISVPTFISPTDSPYYMNVTINHPALSYSDFLYLEGYSNGKLVSQEDCLSQVEIYDDTDLPGGSMECDFFIPYNYLPNQELDIYAVLETSNGQVFSGPYHTSINWAGYESRFWGAFAFLSIAIAAIYIIVILPLGISILYHGMKTKHKGIIRDEYSVNSLLNPFLKRMTFLGKFNSFLISPWFWGIELIGILFVVLYMFLSAKSWVSASSFLSFFVSGLAAFIIPFIWVCLMWFAEYREREPLRIIVTFFLWGCLASLMAIGINTVGGLVFSIFGLGFLGVILIAPLFEELFKGTGLALVAEHHEFDSVEDGIVFGFTIGMGFAFIENWLYLLDNPLGGDVLGWLLLFFMRSILFSANHGVYTAIVGACIGLMKERKFAAPAFGLVPGIIIAGFFHMMHNSSAVLSDLFGIGGALAFFCVMVPIFDYGSLIVIVLLFGYAVLRKKAKTEKKNSYFRAKTR